VARDFDGSDDAGNNLNGLAINVAAITIALWVNVDARTGDDYILNTGRNVTDQFDGLGIYVRAPASAGWQFALRYGGYYNVGQWEYDTDLSLDTWYHIAASYDRGSASNDPVMYVNGSSVTVAEVATPSSDLTTGQDSITVGNLAGGQEFDGMIAELAIWNRALAATEVASLGDGFAPPFIKRGMVHYWPMIRGVEDVKGSANLSLTGTTVVAHPRIIYPRSVGYVRTYRPRSDISTIFLGATA
jgi:hypothetical protein